MHGLREFSFKPANTCVTTVMLDSQKRPKCQADVNPLRIVSSDLCLFNTDELLDATMILLNRPEIVGHLQAKQLGHL